MQQEYQQQAFQVTPGLTPEQERHLVMTWLPLVKKIVRQLAPQCTCVMDAQDMEQVALMGLLSAIRRYGQPDDSFAGYAAKRIRGAILDELRQLDWRPRQQRQKCHQIKDAIRNLRRTLGYEPQWPEIAASGISASDYQEYLQLESAETLASLDELLCGEHSDFAMPGRPLEAQFITQQLLRGALEQLSEKEGFILSMYYQHDMSLKEIALVLNVTESRVCQLNKEIAAKIRAWVYQE